MENEVVKVWRVIGPPRRAWDFIVNYPNQAAAEARAAELGPGYKVACFFAKKVESDDFIWVPEGQTRA